MAKWALIGASYRMQLETAEVSTGVDQVGVKQGMREASFWKVGLPYQYWGVPTGKDYIPVFWFSWDDPVNWHS